MADLLKNRIVQVVGAFTLVFVLVFVILWQSNLFAFNQAEEPKPAAETTATKPAEKKEEKTSLQKQAEELGCDLTPEPIAEPTAVVLPRQKRTLSVISLGIDPKENAPAAPPESQTETFAWYNGGPLVGSEKGKILLSGHTYSDATNGIGNQLLAGLLEPGDLIKVSDSDGNTACYRYRDKTHLLVKDYDPNSNLVYDNESKPELMFFVCDNFNGKDWDGRQMFHADLLTEETVKTLGK